MTNISAKSESVVRFYNALRNAFRKRGPRNRRSRSSFLRFVAPDLKDAGCPLTEEQIKEIRALSQGSESREKMMDILDDDQKEALEKVQRIRRR